MVSFVGFFLRCGFVFVSSEFIFIGYGYVASRSFYYKVVVSVIFGFVSVGV